jgi:ferredoxin-thioredoxin reductase catalytic chain
MDQQRIDKLIDIWKEFASRQTEPEAFMLNADAERVRLVAEGVLNNEDNHGFKYCPCRLTSGNSELDAKLICPCNFKLQKTWKEKGECICSLFVLIK